MMVFRRIGVFLTFHDFFSGPPSSDDSVVSLPLFFDVFSWYSMVGELSLGVPSAVRSLICSPLSFVCYAFFSTLFLLLLPLGLLFLSTFFWVPTLFTSVTTSTYASTCGLAGGAGVIVSGVDVAVAGCGGATASPRIASPKKHFLILCPHFFGIFHNEGGPPPDVHPCCICCKEGIWDIPMIKAPPCGISCTLWCACPRVSAMFGRPPQMPLVQPTLFVVRSFGDLCESPLHHLSLWVPILSLSLLTRWSSAR